MIAFRGPDRSPTEVADLLDAWLSELPPLPVDVARRCAADLRPAGAA